MSTILYEKGDAGIAWVTLNRPDVLNAMNMQMRDELWQSMHAVRDDPDVRAVIFKGAGDRAFSAGADISEFGTAPSYAESRRARRDATRGSLTLPNVRCRCPRRSPRSTRDRRGLSRRNQPLPSCRFPYRLGD